MKKGFTLIELMIVIAIVAILMALVIPNCSGNRGPRPSIEWYTQCYNEADQVFSGMTKDRARYAGDGYYKIDGKIIHAEFCDSEKRTVETVSSVTEIN